MKHISHFKIVLTLLFLVVDSSAIPMRTWGQQYELNWGFDASRFCKQRKKPVLGLFQYPGNDFR